eukprot:g2063.t1
MSPNVILIQAWTVDLIRLSRWHLIKMSGQTANLAAEFSRKIQANLPGGSKDIRQLPTCDQGGGVVRWIKF